MRAPAASPTAKMEIGLPGARRVEKPSISNGLNPMRPGGRQRRGAWDSI